MNKQGIKVPKRKEIRYSESFKLRVVKEIEEGDLTFAECRIKYGIKGGSTIQSWVKKFGKNHLLCRVVKIQTPKELDEKKLLKARIAELEKALANTQLAYLRSESYLTQACHHIGVEKESFKKKQNFKPTDGA